MSYPTPMVPIPPQQKKTSPWLVCSLVGLGCGVLMIPILAAILFPVFAKARESARQSSCASNEKQLGLAVALYSQDNDNRLPPVALWTNAISKYAQANMTGGQGSIVHCPSLSDNAFGYAMNQADNFYAISDLPNPSIEVMFFESDSPNINATGTLSDADLTRHSNGSNLCFIDSHVKWYDSDSVKSESSGSDPTVVWILPSSK
jgi:prepilin-type processing-associated H-X9-DG protein